MSQDRSGPKLVHGCHPRDARHISKSAQLVGVGFRLWFLGQTRGDTSCLEKACQLYTCHLGDRCGQAALFELSKWVRSVTRHASREIDVLPETCPGFCQDECLAIAMIAASQHKTCPALRACAYALIDNAMVDAVVTEAESFAITMLAANQVLSPNFIINAAALSQPSRAGYLH